MDYESLNSVTGLSELVVALVALIAREAIAALIRKRHR